jgi:predicted dehydrogenase
VSVSGPVRVAVLGVGKMGELHLQKLKELESVSVCGIYDTDAERLRALGEKYGVPIYSDPGELFFEADAASIATPTRTHYALCRQALEAGVHVLVEKPIADTVPEAEELVRIAARGNRILQVGLIERFRYRALAGDHHAGKHVRYIEAQRLTPSLGRDTKADVVTDLMIHDLDLVLSLMEQDPVHVSAIGVRVLTDLLDMANVRLEFANGAVVNLSVSRVSNDPVRKFRIFFDDAYASLDFRDNGIKTYTRETAGERSLRLSRRDQVPIDALKDQIADFVDCVRTGRAPIVTGTDGARALRYAKIIVDKIHERASYRGPCAGAEASAREH